MEWSVFSIWNKAHRQICILQEHTDVEWWTAPYGWTVGPKLK